MTTYKMKCDICGAVNEVPTYGEWDCSQCGQGYTYDEGHQIRLTDAQWALLRDQPRWISVAERLPEEGVRVLVCNIYGGSLPNLGGETGYVVDQGVMEGDEWCIQDDPFFCVTHWMPLPEPPITDDVRALHNVAKEIAKAKGPEQTLGDFLMRRRPEPPDVK